MSKNNKMYCKQVHLTMPIQGPNIQITTKSDKESSLNLNNQGHSKYTKLTIITSKGIASQIKCTRSNCTMVLTTRDKEISNLLKQQHNPDHHKGTNATWAKHDHKI